MLSILLIYAIYNQSQLYIKYITISIYSYQVLGFYNLLMDLSLLRDYLEACDQAEAELQQYWPKFARVPAFALFRCIATKSQPVLGADLIRQYLLTFNWQTIFVSQPPIQQSTKFKIHQTETQMQPQQLLDYGIQLLLSQWSENKALTFDQFSLLTKGQHEVPNSKDKQVSYPQKKLLCQCLLHQMKNLIRFQSMKKIVYHQYKNLSDLFQTVTNSRYIEAENIKRLFLSFSERKTDKQIERICKRAKIPWNFNYFINLFKRKDQKQNEFKIHYSSKRNKQFESQNSKAFTTPRKQKFVINQTSTKLTKKYRDEDMTATPKLHTIQQTRIQVQPHTYIQILADLLAAQQKFIDLCSALVKRRDFDLELVYERHGKKFESILNQRYGVCNFSAFTRFIIPRDYQHRYLCFIRYQPDDTLTSETESAIDFLIHQYRNKEAQINQIWKRCDKQMFLRYFCLPKEECIRSQKLREIFSTRQVKVLLQRLDPHRKGQILLDMLI